MYCTCANKEQSIDMSLVSNIPSSSAMFKQLVIIVGQRLGTEGHEVVGKLGKKNCLWLA
jgi:hypothetical protein